METAEQVFGGPEFLSVIVKDQECFWSIFGDRCLSVKVSDILFSETSIDLHRSRAGL